MQKSYLAYTCVIFFIQGCASIISRDTLPKSSIAPVTINACEKIRAAFDLGSTNSKMTVARVDTCLQKIVGAPILREVRKLDFVEDVSQNQKKSKDLAFSMAMMTRAVSEIGEMLEKAKGFGAQEFSAVATEIYRQSVNSGSYIEQLEAKGLQAKIIEQEEEALLGFSAVVGSVSEKSFETIAVWDIGGGSQQITTYEPLNHRFDSFKGHVAAKDFKKKIIEKVLRKNPGVVSSPNPVGKQHLAEAVTLATGIAQLVQKEKPDIKRALSNRKIYGIGGVWAKSVGPYIRSKMATPENLKTAIEELSRKTDQEIGGEFADTTVTNLILVYGMVSYFGIKQVEIQEINLNMGQLINPKYWPSH